jgi:hypothetical protein
MTTIRLGLQSPAEGTSFLIHAPMEPHTRFFVTDINVRFSANAAGFAWNFGAGNAPAGQIDFESTALHELGHYTWNRPYPRSIRNVSLGFYRNYKKSFRYRRY